MGENTVNDKVGIIGGYSTHKVLNDYSKVNIGDDTVCFKGKVGKKEVFIIPRHGETHKYPPHNVPLIKYFEFLKKENIKDLITVHSVGVLNKGWRVPCLIVIDDFIDFTGELATVYNMFDKEPIHVEMEQPYSKSYKGIVHKTIENYSETPFYHGIYFQTVGPRLETRAEIRAAKILGADMVGMTHSWEAILAREYGLNLLSLGMGVNYACGITDKIRYEEIIKNSKIFSDKITKIIRDLIKQM